MSHLAPSKPVCTAALTALLALGAGCEGRHERFLTDDQGRALVLHGLNVASSAKSDPRRMPWVGRDDVLRMSRDWNFNFARFLILWDAVEPEPGVYSQQFGSEDYFDLVEERLDWFQEAGIHVLLDMHQDVYSIAFCCDGAPDWAIRDDGLPFTLQTDVWWANYFQPAVLRSFDNFWDYEDVLPHLPGHHPDLQDHYADAWQVVAERFKDHPAVIGYDIMNEPSPGSQTYGPELVGATDENSTSPRFDAEFLTPFYQRVIDHIREADPDGWIFFEPRYAAPANGLPSYIGPLDDPRPGEHRLVYAPHFYSFLADVGGFYQPDDPAIPNWEKNRREEIRPQSLPLLIGEWGNPTLAEHLQDVADMADRATSGWAYWSYDRGGSLWAPTNGQDEENVELMDILVRAYPRRVAGTPLHYAYDRDTRTFCLQFENEDGVTGATEISVPVRRFYPNGFRVCSTDEDGTWSHSWDASREILSVTHDPDADVHALCLNPPGAGPCPL